MKKTLTKLLTLLGVFLFLGAGNASADYWLVGDHEYGFEEYPSNSKYKFTNENGKPVLYVEALNKGNYKITTGGWVNSFGAKDNDNKYISSLPRTLYTWNSKDQDAFVVQSDLGSVKITIEAVWDDGKNLQLKFERYTSTPSKIYVVGYWQNGTQQGAFSPSQGLEIPYNSSTKTYTKDVTFYGAGGNNDKGMFWFADALTGNWDTMGRHGAPEKNYDKIIIGGTSTLSSNDNSFIVYPGTYTVTVNESKTSVTLTRKDVQLPKTLYLYGHVNNGYWAPKNNVPLKEVSPGKYVNDYVEIGGFWSEKDSIMDNSRKKYHAATTCYVALYDRVNTTLKDFDKYNESNNPKYTWKFGSVMAQNNENREYNDHFNTTGWWNCNVFGNEGDTNNKLNGKAKLWYQEEWEVDNFIVKSGFYEVSVDLEAGTIEFKETAERRPRTYVWYTGQDLNKRNPDGTFEVVTSAELITGVTDESHDIGENHSAVSFDYVPGEEYIIQAGIGENTEHVLARMVSYDVWYKAPSASDATGKPKRRVGELDSNITPADVIAEDNENVPKNYTLVYSTNSEINDGTVATMGNNELDSNYLLKLSKAGDYVISATRENNDGEYFTVTDNGVVKTYSVTPTSLAVSIAAETLTLSVADAVMPFSNTKDNLSFSIDKGTSTITSADITATFKPYDMNDGWLQTYDGNLSVNLTAEKDALAQGDLNIDGIYTADYQANVKVQTGSNGELYVSVPALPCSGRYQLTLTSNNVNYSFQPVDADIYIYPTTLNNYGVHNYYTDDQGNFTTSETQNGHTLTGLFNVNGINWTAPTSVTSSDYSGEILYPYIDGKIYMDGELDNSHIYTPGVYLTQEMKVNVVAGPSSSANAKRRAASFDYDDYTKNTTLASGYSDYTPNQTINLEALESNAQVVYVYLKKNGAYTPIENDNQSIERYIINVKQNGGTIPTGVDTIGAEEGEAVYFNLQGVRVENPEHGIYVKVVDGKATKVVL